MAKARSVIDENVDAITDIANTMRGVEDAFHNAWFYHGKRGALVELADLYEWLASNWIKHHAEWRSDTSDIRKRIDQAYANQQLEGTHGSIFMGREVDIPGSKYNFTQMFTNPGLSFMQIWCMLQRGAAYYRNFKVPAIRAEETVFPTIDVRGVVSRALANFFTSNLMKRGMAADGVYDEEFRGELTCLNEREGLQNMVRDLMRFLKNQKILAKPTDTDIRTLVFVSFYQGRNLKEALEALRKRNSGLSDKRDALLEILANRLAEIILRPAFSPEICSIGLEAIERELNATTQAAIKAGIATQTAIRQGAATRPEGVGVLPRVAPAVPAAPPVPAHAAAVAAQEAATREAAAREVAAELAAAQNEIAEALAKAMQREAEAFRKKHLSGRHSSSMFARSAVHDDHPVSLVRSPTLSTSSSSSSPSISESDDESVEPKKAGRGR